MDETEYIWMNGKFVKWHDAKVHVLTHTLHYGMGVYDALRCYKTDRGAAIFRLDAHVDRFVNSFSTIFLTLPYSREEIRQAIIDTIKKNKIEIGYIRSIAFHGYGKMGLDPTGAEPQLSISCWPWKLHLGTDPIRVKTSRYLKNHPQTSHTELKICGHYVNGIFAHREARDSGYDEAILLNEDGYLTEGPVENIFMVKDGKLLTSKLGNILAGITRNSVIEIAKNEDIDVIEKDLTLADLKSADEVFMTGTAAEITAIKQIDETDIPVGPIAKKLITLYQDIIHGKNSQYDKWLTYVK